MAAPTLQAEGATVAVTTGAPSITIPTHQADDILVVAATFWGPNTAGDAAQIPTPSGWTLLDSQVGQPAAANRDGWSAWFWLRATGAGHTVTLTRGASWDTGNDTCYGARAYVIRGCRTTGNPWDDTTPAGPHTAANQAFGAVTVNSVNRLVVQFGNSQDNAAFALTSTGWTTGTEDNDATGTDCSFQTARKTTSASTSADTATASAPAQGAYAFMGVSFNPVVTAALTGTVTTASEADIIAGGKTIILTLTDEEWVAAGATFDAQRQNIINGLTSAQGETLGWNNVVKALQGVSGVVRTSATVVTITLDAQITYSITANETITVTIPASALLGGLDAVVASPTFTITEGTGQSQAPRSMHQYRLRRAS